ncbi:MAG TPA: hypothetical protein VNO26_16655 [Candidatus Limnocylindria bacterium]|nr:hypothetical protein [Candidatus Limnocylindria bacterium]
MAHADHPEGDGGEQQALATLLARIAEDRDRLVAGLERTEAAVGRLGSRLDALAGELGELRRTCLEMGEQAARHAERAAADVAESSARALAGLRDEMVRRAGESETRVAARLDAVTVAVEAERAAREGVWERVAAVEERLQQLEVGLASAHARAEALEARAAQAGRGLLACVRDEVVAVVMAAVSVGVVVGRLGLALLR